MNSSRMLEVWAGNRAFPAKPTIKIEPGLDPADFITSYNVKKKFPNGSLYNFYNSVYDTESRTFILLRKYKDLLWWQPDPSSIPAQFLEGSSMHGLKYVAQPKRHMIERIFWLVSFLACVSGAVVMIMEIWNRYYMNPVIVTFNPAEQDLDTIPFPAITICNVNPFKKSTVANYVNQYRKGRTEAERMKALDALRLINGICLTQPSFLQNLNFAPNRGQLMPEAQDNPSPEAEKNLVQFLLKNSQPCSELLRLCVWEQKQYDCEQLFKPIITDYGKCCTFNTLPQELMEPHHGATTSTIVNDSQTQRKVNWSKKDIEEWNKWDYDTHGYILKEELKFPYRQHRAGSADGLTLLLDPNVEENFCPGVDSEGVKVLYHVPLEAPRVADLGTVVGTNRELYLEVNPDLTIADNGIESFSHEARKCYFGLEYKLNFYRPYTRSNCIEEFWTNMLIENCGCVLYYAPRNATTNICSTTLGTNDYNCVKDMEQKSLGKLHKLCSQCKYSCNDLTYAAEITHAKLQDSSLLFSLANGTKYDWTNHKLTVLHIFMGADSTVPKLRAKLYQAVDLIANTGGILGLSVGFSVLSAVEVVYFVTLKICCKQLRKSKRFGIDELSNNGFANNKQNNLVLPITMDYAKSSAHKSASGLNRLSLLDNSLFLHSLKR